MAVRAVKSVKQNYEPTAELLDLLEDFRSMVNDCIRIGIETGTTSLKGLSLKAYHQLTSYDVLSYYKLCAISKATGILKNYHKAVRKSPKVLRPHVRPILSKPLRWLGALGFVI